LPSPSIALQQVSSKFARDNAAKTLEKPIALRYCLKHLTPIAEENILALRPDGAVYVWGAKAERAHQTVKLLERQSIVLFRRGPNIYKRGVVVEVVCSEALAEALWGRDKDGETWSNVFFFTHIQDMNYPAARVNRHLKRNPRDNWQGLVVLPITDSAKVQEFLETSLNAP
jgi:hypothetical protein